MTAGVLAPRAGTAPAPESVERKVRSMPVIIALLTILAGVVAGSAYLFPQAPGEQSADVGFARDMSQHHGQAVAMSEAIRARTQDPEVRALAADVALTQQGQIGIMNGWLSLWGRSSSGPGPGRMAWMGAPVEGLMPGMATQEDVIALSSLPVPEAEVRYLQLMVAHHTGGVAMATAGAQLADKPQVVQLAKDIAASQASEIEYLQSLLAARGLPPAVTGPGSDMAMAPTGGHGAAGSSGAASVSVGDALLLSVVALGLVAAFWLLIDTVARQAGVRPVRLQRIALVLVASAVAGAVLHLVLTPQHAAENGMYGTFFLVSTLALGIGAAAVLAGLLAPGAVMVAVTSAVLAVTYLLFRVVPPPGSAAVEDVDAWGVLAVTLEVIAVACAAVLLRRSRRGALGVGTA